MKERMADLDELVLSCRDLKAREYVAEAVACYHAGAFRSCIVSTWLAVSFDFFDKTAELASLGDTEAERFLHGERVVGRNVNFVAQGGRSNVDFVTQNRFTGSLRAVESKFGRSAQLVRGQPAVTRQLQLSGQALVRGPKSVTTVRGLGFTGGSIRHGVNVSGIGFVEQRFDRLDDVFRVLFY